MWWRKQGKHSVVDSLIGSNSIVNGDIKFTGGCHIDGAVNGNVSADLAGSSTLSVSEDGTIEGGVSAPYVALSGVVRGDVCASQRVELGPSARVIGDVYYNLIEMAIGAEINGKLVHQPEGQVPLLEGTGSEIESPAKIVSIT